MIRVSFIEVAINYTICLKILQIVVIFFVYIGSITESLTQTQFRMSLFFGLLGVFQDVIWLLQNTKVQLYKILILIYCRIGVM